MLPSVRAQGGRPITRIELVRNNRYVFTRDFNDAALEHTIAFRDTEPPPVFYYARVTHERGGWAWTSPIWIDLPRQAVKRGRSI